MSYATLSSLLAAQSRKFIHVTFAWSAPKNTELVKPIFDPADDWIRYSPNCWILYTGNGPDWWYDRIRRHMVTSDRVFIFEINLKNKAGWLDQWVWDWLNRPRL